MTKTGDYTDQVKQVTHANDYIELTDLLIFQYSSSDSTYLMSKLRKG
jgi:hypothetical protein